VRQFPNLQIFEIEGNPLSVSSAMSNKSRDDNHNLQSWQQQLESARASGDRELEGVSLTNLGSVYYELNESVLAIESSYQGLLIFQEIGDRERGIWALNNIGTYHNKLDQYDKAVEAYTMAINLSRSIGTLVREGWIWKSLGRTYRLMRQYDQAIEAFQQAIKVFQETSSKDETEEVRQLLTEIQQERDQ
jgi:tetratricopeptide (TPR) repeat protein